MKRREWLIGSAAALASAPFLSSDVWADAAPLSPREQMAFTWTGHELLVWGGISFAAGRQTVGDGAAYDPTTNRWRALAEAPLISRWGATVGWTGELAIVVGGNGPSGPGVAGEPPAKGAAAYRP